MLPVTGHSASQKAEQDMFAMLPSIDGAPQTLPLC